MNMSDDVAGAVIQMSTKAVETGSHLIMKVADLIAKLLEILMAAKRNAEMSPKVDKTDLTDIKPGAVPPAKLKESAKKNGDQIVFSEQGLTKADQRYIAEKAKAFGIPVAFTKADGKDNIYAQVRKNDLPVFQHICTDMMKDKLAERPQTLGNIKCNEWEMQYLTRELNNYDLAASFGKTREGEFFCLYEKSDEKAIMIARAEFQRKGAEVEADLRCYHSEDGFYTLVSEKTGEEISFDEIPSKDVLAEQIRDRFGYDENKAQIAAGKFGEEMLKGEERTRFFANDPQDAFSKIEGNITVEGEDILAKAYTCWRLTPKTDELPRIVFRSAEGDLAILRPEQQTAKQMRETLRTQLGITDEATLAALTDKAQKVSDAYLTTQNSTLDVTLDKSQFDLSDPQTVEGMRRTDADGHVYTKTQPVDHVHTSIERTGRDSFTVTSSVTASERDEAGTVVQSTDTRERVLSFSDKKNAIAELSQLYQEQGIPAHISKEMAKDVFSRARTQTPEKVVLLEEVRANTIRVTHEGRSAHINVIDRDRAVAEICDKFSVSKEVSEQILSRAEQHRAEAQTRQQDAGATQRTLDAARANVLQRQADQTDLSSALDRLTDREQMQQDTMIVCSATDPQSYIKVSASHNGDRVVHDYAVYRDGMQQEAAAMFGTAGVFTDQFSKDEEGKPVMVQQANGKTTSYWNAMKQDMTEKSGLDKEHVLVFSSQEAFDRFQEDAALLQSAEAETKVDAAALAPKSEAIKAELPEMGGKELPEAPKVDSPTPRR